MSVMNLEARRQADLATLEPGFWPNWQAPNPLSVAIQMPLADTNWQTRVLNGYARTSQRFAGRAALSKDTPDV